LIPSIEEQESELALEQKRKDAQQKFDEGFAEYEQRREDEELARLEEEGHA